MLYFKKTFIISTLLLLSVSLFACSNQGNQELENKIKSLEERVTKLESESKVATEYFTKQLELQKQAEEADKRIYAPNDKNFDVNKPIGSLLK